MSQALWSRPDRSRTRSVLARWAEALAAALLGLACADAGDVREARPSTGGVGEAQARPRSVQGGVEAGQDTVLILSADRRAGRLPLPDSVVDPPPEALLVPVLRIEGTTGFSVIGALALRGSERALSAGRFTPLRSGTYMLRTGDSLARLGELAADSLRRPGVELQLRLQPIHEDAGLGDLRVSFGVPRRMAPPAPPSG